MITKMFFTIYFTASYSKDCYYFPQKKKKGLLLLPKWLMIGPTGLAPTALQVKPLWECKGKDKGIPAPKQSLLWFDPVSSRSYKMSLTRPNTSWFYNNCNIKYYSISHFNIQFLFFVFIYFTLILNLLNEYNLSSVFVLSP